jgi:hypothetical protein
MALSMLGFRRNEARTIAKLAKAFTALGAPPRPAPKRAARMTLGV